LSAFQVAAMDVFPPLNDAMELLPLPSDEYRMQVRRQ
jgi:hypothetical protein